MGKLKKTIIAATAAATIGGSYMIGTKNAEELSPTEKIVQTGKKRWVAYSPKSFGQKADFKKQFLVSTAVKKEMKAQTKGFDGFVFEATNQEIAEKKKVLKIQDSDWKIVEDRIYKLDSGCNRTPEPDPTPTPAQVPWGVKRVQAIEAMQITNGSDILVCITDTGTDQQHPDIMEMLAGGESQVPGVSSWDDDQDHGTHVAGTVAAQMNNRDVVGVSQAKIFTEKVLDSRGSGYGSWIANGIAGCVRAGAKIISMSLGSPASSGPDPLISDALAFAHSKGVISICAAGNDGGEVGFPAQNCTYAVGATDTGDKLASFSSRGDTMDILAPGVGIPSLKNGGGVIAFSGTSMATPHVAGACALSLAAGKGCKLVTDNVGLKWGRLNALKSVQ